MRISAAIRLTFLGCFLLSRAFGQSPCIPFPSGYVPFSSIYYVAGPNSAGDRLVVGKPAAGASTAAQAGIPVPAFPDQTFCDALVQLGPQNSYSNVYVPSANERNGDFSAFAGLIYDPASNQSYPGGIIPVVQQNTVFGWRIAQSIVSPPNSAQRIITTVAGTDWHFPAQTLPALNAPLGAVSGPAVDGAGNVYFADPSNNMVMKVTPDGTLTVVAGNGVIGYSGDNGPATSASLDNPIGVAVDPSGNIFIADAYNCAVRKVAGGVISTVAGVGRVEFNFNGPAPGDGGLATEAGIGFMSAIATDASGNLYIAEQGRIREITGGIINTIVGNGSQGYSGDNGPAVNAQLQGPAGIAIDAKGNLYIVDDFNIRKVTAGIITTIAGPFSAPFYVTVNDAGNLYVSDGSVVRMITGGNVTVIAGGGAPGSPDAEGPATAAGLSTIGGLALDGVGNLYIADSGYERLHKVSGGNIATVAGDGAYGYCGDGGAAVSACLSRPAGIALDSNGNLYVAEGGQRIRRVSGGIITTVAGNGTAGYSGDNGPATNATLNVNATSLVGLAASSSGDLYLADQNGQVIRKVSNGVITTLATSKLTQGLAVDSANNLYVAAAQQINRISNGVTTTVAGNGMCCAAPGDGGPATSANVSPAGIAVDAFGNLDMVDLGSASVRQVSGGIINTVAHLGGMIQGIAVDAAGDIFVSDTQNIQVGVISGGTVQRVAGNGSLGYSGDGGPATSASFGLIPPAIGIGGGGLGQLPVAVDSAGNLFIADTYNNRIREVPASSASLAVEPGTLDLSAASDGKPVTAGVTVATALNGPSPTAVAGMAYSAQVANDAPWLSVTPQSGSTPGLMTVTADPTGLPPAPYSGTITLNVANASPSTGTVKVQFTVGATVQPNLAVDHTHLSFTYSNTSAARTQTITVSNTGGGPLPFTVSITTNPGQSANWLRTAPASATATPAASAVLTVTADPTSLAVGTYSANIVITSAAGAATVSVTMTISANPLILLLSQTGLTFTAAQNGGAVPPQTFSVLNLGSGTLNWTAQTSVLGGVNNWLAATPASGASASATSSTGPVVMVSVNASGLAPGVYYGLVTITAPGAANTPQGVVAILQVLPAGTDIAPVVQPSSLDFTGPAGDSSPGSQNVAVYDPTGTSKSFRSGIVTVNGGNWLVTLPSDATIPSNGPVNVVVQPIVNNLTPGTYQGTLTLQFSDGRVSTVTIQFVVAGASAHARPVDTGDPCTPTQLMPSLVTLGSGFSVPAGYPQGLEAQVFDNCGNPQVNGSVYVSFNNGDAPVKLQSLGNGVWDGTWPVGSTPASVTLTVAAQDGSAVKGQNQINGGLSAAMPSPMVFNGGVVNSAGLAGQTVAPGELISIFGQQLSGGQLPAGSGQLPFSLAATAVAIGSQSGPAGGTFQALPLYYASSTLVNAVVPYSTSVNTNQQILVQWGTSYAPPVYVDVAAAAPQVFQLTAQQGAITDLNYNVIGPDNPAHVGQVIVLYCSGLGAVDPSVADGAGSIGPSYAQNPVTVTIGGQTTATPVYAGLTPGVAGLYQINVAVPQGVAPGDNIPVGVTVAGQTSAQVFTSVR